MINLQVAFNKLNNTPKYVKIKWLYVILQMIGILILPHMLHKHGVLIGCLISGAPTLFGIAVICICSSLLGLLAVGCALFTRND